MSQPAVIEIGVAKTEKYATAESGDTATLVVRPGGGASIVLVDGQSSGRGARAMSQWLAAKAVALIQDGVRDGAVARAVHDVLFTARRGQVSATLDILSLDLSTRTVVITRNAAGPVILGRAGHYEAVPCHGEPIGRYQATRPAIWEIPIELGLQVVLCTDGVAGAGERLGHGVFDVQVFANATLSSSQPATAIAEAVLAAALARDDDRPHDDMTVVTLRLAPSPPGRAVERWTAAVPIR